jgi:hypothetical protein
MCLNSYNKHSDYLISCVLFIFECILENTSEATNIEAYKNALIREIVSSNNHSSNKIRNDTKDIVEFLNKKGRVSSVCRLFGNNDDAYHFLAIDTEIYRFISKHNLWEDGSRKRCNFVKARRVIAGLV